MTDTHVFRLELLQRVSKRERQRLFVVSGKVDCFGLSQDVRFVVARKLGTNDHLVSVVARLHPFTDPLFGFLVLAVFYNIAE